MTIYDFIVTNREKAPTGDTVSLKLTVEKVATLDDDVTLERALQAEGVEHSAIGAIIEQLETLPYGARHAYAIGSNGRILVEQI